MKFPLLPLLLAALTMGSAQAQAALSPASLDAQLLNNCNARLDARMEGMSQSELDYVRRAEFGLRLAMAPFRADPDDTYDVVQQRMVAYYDNLLERRAAPVVKKWSRPAPQAAATSDEGSDVIEMDAETEEVVAEIEGEIAELPAEDEEATAA